MRDRLRHWWLRLLIRQQWRCSREQADIYVRSIDSAERLTREWRA